MTEKDAYYKQPILEISALKSALPDEALQVLRYTIEPQISKVDKKKPWIWMERLRFHYTGTIESSLMIDRFKFWSSSQYIYDIVQDWEVKVRQTGNLCGYGDMTDEMCGDKFVFGLQSKKQKTLFKHASLITHG